MYASKHCDSYDVQCSCTTFTIRKNDIINSDTVTATSCFHIQLIKEILNGDESNQNSFIIITKLYEARFSSNEEVLTLPSKNRVDRFSVVADGSAEFVTKIPETDKNLAKYNASICKILEGSTRNIKCFCKGNRLCSYLKEFKVFYNLHLRQAVKTKKMAVMME